jgi:hypothetical protein
MRWIEEATMDRCATRARPAVQEDDRLALGMAGLLVKERVPAGDFEATLDIGFTRRIEPGERVA